MNEPEFYATATVGFRQWHLAVKDGSPVLESVMNFLGAGRTTWDAQGVNIAICVTAIRQKGNYFSNIGKGFPDPHTYHPGEPPDPDCKCGLYAYGDCKSSLTDPLMHSLTGHTRVRGIIAGWGYVETYDKAFRAQYAKVLALFRGTGGGYVSRANSELIERLAVENGIPLLEPDELSTPETLQQYADERNLATLAEIIRDTPISEGI